jgi:hypothetical protein
MSFIALVQAFSVLVVFGLFVGAHLSTVRNRATARIRGRHGRR